MDPEQQMRINSLLNSFHPLEGFEGRVHGRYIQGHMRDPNTESLADMCCWVNSGMYGLGVKKKQNSQRPVTYNSNRVSGLFFFLVLWPKHSTDYFLTLQNSLHHEKFQQMRRMNGRGLGLLR